MKATLAVLVYSLVFFTVVQYHAHALTISPTKLEVAGDPGQTIIGEIELFNEQDEAKLFYTSYENFEPRGETGAPYFVGGGSGLATWLTTQTSVSINAGERVLVPYTLTIPADATPGGYFAAVFFGSNPPGTGEAGGEISIGGKVGSLVLLRVNGTVAESGGLLDFSTLSGKTLFTSVPVILSYRFNNTGGDRVIPRGDLVVKNTLGMTVKTLPVNPTEGSVLPNSVRKFEVIWNGQDDTTKPEKFWEVVKYQAQNFHLGLYSVTMSIVWGETQQHSSETIRLVLLPWQLLMIVGLGLIIFYIVLKLYNRIIIARANRV
jgi:hypothetical protein